MENNNKKPSPPGPPAMNPYIFTGLLIGFGLWCFWDGFLTSDVEMQEHATFNKVLSIFFLVWGVYDFFKIRKRQKKAKQSED